MSLGRITRAGIEVTRRGPAPARVTRAGLEVLWVVPEPDRPLPPAIEATDIGETWVDLESTEFVHPDGARTHRATRWQVALDRDFADVLDTHTSQVDLLSWHAEPLPPDTVIWVRAGHQDDLEVWSDWSAPISVTTLRPPPPPARTIENVEIWPVDRSARLPIPGTGGEFDNWPYIAEAQIRERLGEPAELTLTFHVGAAPVIADPIYLSRRRVVAIPYDDGSFEEYRIIRFQRELSGESPATVTAQSLWTDLDTRVARRYLEASGFVDVGFVILRRDAQILLDLIMEDAPHPFIAGSAGPFIGRNASIISSGSTHLALLRQLCQDLGAEWEAVWDPAEDAYRIDLVEEIGGPGVRPIEQGSGTHGNRRTLRRDHDGSDLFTRIVPLSGSDDEIVTIARATWPIIGATVAGGLTTLRLGGDPIWIDGSPFGDGEAGQFGAGEAWYTVRSTTVPDTVVVQGDARGLAAGRFRLASGSDLTYIADPGAEAEAGVVERTERRADIPPHANLLEEAGVTADFTVWAGGLPVGTSPIGDPTISETNDPRYARVGGSAALIEAGAGEGLGTIPIQLTPGERTPYFSASVAVRVISGAVQFDLIGSDGRSYPLGDSATSSEDLLRALQIGGLRPPAGAARLRVVALQAGTTFALDAWTLTQSPTPFDYSPDMGPQALWHVAARILARDGGLTPDALEGGVFDVAYFDGTGADEIRIGTRVQVADSGLDLETRVVELLRRYKTEEEYRKTVTLSRHRQDFIDYLGAAERPERRLGEAGPAEPAPTVSIQGVRIEGGRIVVSAGGNATVTRIYVTAAVGAAPPVPTPEVNHGTIESASGTVLTTVEAVAGDVIRVMARGENAAGVLGPVAEAEIQAPTAAGAPSIEVDIAEDGTTGTLWWRIVEHGIAVTSLSVTQQTGDRMPVVAPSPARSAGDASVVRGGLLGYGEYEHDVVLDDDRFSYILVTLALASGDQMTVGPVYFDRDDDPTLVSASAVGRKVNVIGDSDSRSAEVRKKGGGWRQIVNGMAATFDLSLPDGNGSAAMGASETWQVEAIVYGAPRELVGPATKKDWREITVGGESAVPGAQWIRVDAYLPSTNVTHAAVMLWANGAPAGYSVRVWRQVEYWHRVWGHRIDPEEDRTGELGVTTVPTVQTEYADVLPWTRHPFEEGGSQWTTEVRVWYRAELLDGAAVVDSREVFLEYRTADDVGD